MLFDPAHFAYWLFLLIGIALFALIIFSGVGVEGLDLDDGPGGIAGNLPLLSWVGIGKAPILLLFAVDFSLWGLTGWMLNVGVAELVGSVPQRFFGWGGVVFFTSLFFSLFVGSLVSRVAGQLFVTFGEDASGDRFLGGVGTVISTSVPFENERGIGQVHVRDRAGNLLKINAFAPEWAEERPQRGQEVVVIDRQTSSYLVVLNNSLDQQRWLANL